MDDDDQSAAEAHQMELEQRQRDEVAAINRCRGLTGDFRQSNAQFENEMKLLNESIRSELCRR